MWALPQPLQVCMAAPWVGAVVVIEEPTDLSRRMLRTTPQSGDGGGLFPLEPDLKPPSQWLLTTPTLQDPGLHAGHIPLLNE